MKTTILKLKKLGLAQPDKYFDKLLKYIEDITNRLFSFESVDYVKKGYRRCVCGADSIYYEINGDVAEIMAIIGF